MESSARLLRGARHTLHRRRRDLRQFDSADVWTHPEIFEFSEDLTPIRVAGVPPDYFSETGQRWGNPIYKWEVLEKRGFDWWVDRMRRARALYDIIRLDHFRGFEAFWAIPAEDETAIHGEWVKAPGAALFTALRDQLGALPLIAEDLGLITREVDALREQFDLPGMRVLQFGFSGRACAQLSAPPLCNQHGRLYRHPRQRHHSGLVATRHDGEREERGLRLSQPGAQRRGVEL